MALDFDDEDMELASIPGGPRAPVTHLDVDRLKERIVELEKQVQAQRCSCLVDEGELAQCFPCQQTCNDLETKPAVAVEALRESLVVINNLMPSLEGHISPVMRKHPSPCAGLDFCVVKDATKRRAKIENALAKLEASE